MTLPLLRLASLASSATWKSKIPPTGSAGSAGSVGRVDSAGSAGSVGSAAASAALPGAAAEAFWCPDAAVALARAAAVGVAEAEGAWLEAEGGAVGQAALQVRVTLREVYWEIGGAGRKGGASGASGAAGAGDAADEEGGDRRSCSFRIDFTRVGAEVTRGDAALWQSRIREAVHLWQAEARGQFELR